MPSSLTAKEPRLRYMGMLNSSSVDHVDPVASSSMADDEWLAPCELIGAARMCSLYSLH